MFEQTFVPSPLRTRNPWSVAVSLSVQCLVVAVLLLIPLLHPEALRMPEIPQPLQIRTWINQPPPPVQAANSRGTAATASLFVRPVFVAPDFRRSATGHVEVPFADSEAAWSGPATVGLATPLVGAMPLPTRAVVQPPVASPEKKPVANGPLKVSEGVQAARLLFGPRPAYPPLAKVARSQGVVRLEAIIAADGGIRNLRVVSGPPLLVDAALGAVRQWRYQPTLLNGVEVEVVTEIDVNFTLTQ